MRTAVPVVAFLAALAMAIPAASQDLVSTSAQPAATLVKLMTDKGLDAIAAPDPQDPGRFVAALCFPGTQLLVVSARYPAPKQMDAQLKKHDYQGVYMELQGGATEKGRFFVQDMQADGLKPKAEHGGAVDIVYENGVKLAAFDGDYKAQQMTEAAYDSAFQEADRRYAHMLSALAAALGGAQ